MPFQPQTIGDGFTSKAAAELEWRVLNLMRQVGLLPQTVVRSFDHRSVLALRRLEPHLTTGILVANTAPVQPAELVRAAEANLYCPNVNFLDESQVRQLQQAGVPVLPWTVNEEADLATAVRLGRGRHHHGFSGSVGGLASRPWRDVVRWAESTQPPAAENEVTVMTTDIAVLLEAARRVRLNACAASTISGWRRSGNYRWPDYYRLQCRKCHLWPDGLRRGRRRRSSKPFRRDIGDFSAIAIVADTRTPTPPCGACRQILWEFGGDLEIILGNLERETVRHQT